MRAVRRGGGTALRACHGTGSFGMGPIAKGLLHSPRKGDQSPLRSIRNRLLLSLPLRTSLCSLGLHLTFAFGECSTGAPLGSGPPRLCLSSLRSSRAAKAQGKNFCSRRASSASQKFILAPHMSLLRIIHGGAAAPPNLPEFSGFQTISVAQPFVIMTSVVNTRGCCSLSATAPGATAPCGFYALRDPSKVPPGNGQGSSFRVSTAQRNTSTEKRISAAFRRASIWSSIPASA